MCFVILLFCRGKCAPLLYTRICYRSPSTIFSFLSGVLILLIRELTSCMSFFECIRAGFIKTCSTISNMSCAYQTLGFALVLMNMTVYYDIFKIHFKYEFLETVQPFHNMSCIPKKRVIIHHTIYSIIQ